MHCTTSASLSDEEYGLSLRGLPKYEIRRLRFSAIHSHGGDKAFSLCAEIVSEVEGEVAVPNTLES